MSGGTNPLLSVSGVVDFRSFDAADVVPAITELLARAEREFDALEPALAPRWESCVAAVDAVERPLEDLWRNTMHMSSVANSDALREAIDTVQGPLVRFGMRVGQSRPLFDALEALAADAAALSPAQRRSVERRLRGMRAAGVGLDGDDRARFTAIMERLSELGTRFSNNVLDATRAWHLDIVDPERLRGVSEVDRAVLAAGYARATGTEADVAQGPWRVGLDFPSVRAVLDDASDRSLREEVQGAFGTRATRGDSNNEPLIREILELRAESARILGFATFADLQMEARMAGVSSATALLETLRAAAWEPYVAELAALEQYAVTRGHEGRLESFDLRFWRARMREERFGFTSDELRPYFPVPRVLTGLFALIERLFGVQIVEATADASRWDDQVQYFRVFDRGGEIAGFYLDMYARPENKRSGAWMQPLLPRRRVNGALQLPVAVLVCNAAPPLGGRPSTLSFDDVLTLFHEFGHGLQHMLTEVELEDLSGTGGIEWDAVELPSQFMENWCYHWETVAGMTAHTDTGEPIPRELFDKVCAAKNFFAAQDLLRQVAFGLTDLELHTVFDPAAGDADAVYRANSARTSLIPPRDGDRFLCSFAHIFAGGYAAGYYSYKWAEVLSADAFGAFEDAGLDSPPAVERTGRHFRETVLALGGSVEPAEVFRRFRGRDATPDAVLRHNGLSAPARATPDAPRA